MYNSLRPHGLQHARLLCLPPSLRVCSNSCPLSQWCHLTLLSSAAPFCFCLQSFPTSGAFPMNQLFTSGGQSIRASVSASVLPMNSQGWLPLGLSGLIFLQSEGLSSTFSSTTIQKHQFFGTQPFLWSNSHIYTWWLEKTITDYMDLCRQSNVCFLICSLGLSQVFLPRNKRLLISCLQSSSTVILEPKRRKSVTVSTFFPFYLPGSDGIGCRDLSFFNVEFQASFLTHSISPLPSGSLVPLHFLPLEWYHLHIWGCYFSW